MSATSVRCYNCGKRVSPEVRVCPACGADQLQHVIRIRCGYCGRRVPARARICPACGHNPRRFYLRLRHLLYPVALAALALLIFAAMNAPVWFHSLAASSKPAATVSVTATRAIVVAAATPSRVAVALPTNTLVAVQSPSPTLVPPTQVPPTSTRPPTAMPTATRRPTVARPSPTATATRIVLAPPVLVGPRDGQALYSLHARIILSFHGTAPLGDGDWFRVQIDFRDRLNQPFSWCGWSRSNSILFPADYYDESWQLDRTFRWHVNLAQPESDQPSTCAAVVTNASAPSTEWTFYWY